MHLLPLTFIVFAFAVSGAVLQRRLPGTLRASERLVATIAVVYFQFQLSLAIPGLLGVLQPIWVAFTSLFLAAIVLIVSSRYTPEPMLRLPSSENTDEIGLRHVALILLAITGLVAIFMWLPMLTHPISYNDRAIYLNRVAQWLQERFLTLSPGDDPRAIATPIVATFPALFHVLFFQTAAAINLWNWFGWLLCGLAMYVAAQRWLESRFAGIVAATMTMLAPAMLAQMNGIAPFGWELAFAVTGLHFLAHGRARPQHAKFAHLAATVALALSASLQQDLPVSILLFAILLIVFKPAIQRRFVARNVAVFLVIAGWNHLYTWIQFGYPTAPMLGDVFNTPTGATNPFFRDLVSSIHSFVSWERIVARVSAAVLPVPLTENDVLLNVGFAALLLGCAGLILAALRNIKTMVRDPLWVGLVLLTLVSIKVAPSLLWRETPMLPVIALCGVGAGYAFKIIADRKILSIGLAIIPVIATIVASIILIPSLQPGFRDNLTQSSPRHFLESISLPDRVATYRTEWMDIWTLRQPLSQRHAIVEINPQLEPDWAFFKASLAGCDWLIMTDSPLHRHQLRFPLDVPEGWELISDDHRMLYASPGWLRIIIFHHVQRSVAIL